MLLVAGSGLPKPGTLHRDHVPTLEREYGTCLAQSLDLVISGIAGVLHYVHLDWPEGCTDHLPLRNMKQPDISISSHPLAPCLQSDLKLASLLGVSDQIQG